MDGDSEVECLYTTATGITIGESATHFGEHRIVSAHPLPHDDVPRFNERASDLLTPGRLSDTGISIRIVKNNEVSGKVWAMGATEIEACYRALLSELPSSR